MEIKGRLEIERWQYDYLIQEKEQGEFQIPKYFATTWVTPPQGERVELTKEELLYPPEAIQDKFTWCATMVQRKCAAHRWQFPWR